MTPLLEIYGANAVSVLQKHYIILLSYIRAMGVFSHQLTGKTLRNNLLEK